MSLVGWVKYVVKYVNGLVEISRRLVMVVEVVDDVYASGNGVWRRVANGFSFHF